MKKQNDPRHSARFLAIQTLFSENFKISKNKKEYSLKELKEISEIKKYDKELFSKLVKGVKENKTEIDEVIQKYAPQWPVENIKKVDIEILRIAVFEGFFAEITPPKVAIDEAIELAKELSGEASDKFINGVLGAIYETQK